MADGSIPEAAGAAAQEARLRALERWLDSPLSTGERIDEVQQFAEDLAATVATMQTIARAPAFAGDAAELVALREAADTLRIRMEGLDDVLGQLAEHWKRATAAGVRHDAEPMLPANQN